MVMGTSRLKFKCSANFPCRAFYSTFLFTETSNLNYTASLRFRIRPKTQRCYICERFLILTSDMEKDSDIPKEIPLDIQMAEISEKMQRLNYSTLVEAPCASSSGAAQAQSQGQGAAGNFEGGGDVPGMAGGSACSEGTSSSTSTAGAMSVEQILAGVDAGGDHNGPVVMIIVGMAGSGKTTLTQRLTAELMQRKSPPYIVNLDPACNDPPYPVNIDIRDVIKYKKVMEAYNLGPNGAIVTSLNLFATKFNEVLAILQQKRKTHQYIIIDTPGQIEVFTWSASGNIITESLAALFPTVMIYVTDLVSNMNPITFISNMTFACSMLYKTKLPLVIALNKCDQADPKYAKDWITDFETFDAALRLRNDYSANLASSLALTLDEFYNKIDHTVVSAFDGYGMNEFFCAVQKAVSDYELVYRPMYLSQIEEKKKLDENKKQAQLNKLKRDLATSVASEDEESCFVLPGRDAGAGLSLRLDDANDEDTSSDEEAAPVQDENEEQSFGTMFAQESERRVEKEKVAGGSQNQNPKK